MRVAVHELKDHLSEYLRRAADGEEVIVTRHGRPIAQLTPFVAEGGEDREEVAVARLRAEPWIIPARCSASWRPVADPIPARAGEASLSDIVLEERE